MFSYLIRQIGALFCAATLAFEYCRDPSISFESFSNWALFLHFIYFQLPLRSRALAFAHSTSFIGANIIPAMYLHLLVWKPRLELNHMDQWEISWSTILTRSFLMHFAPLLFHGLDIAANQVPLINSYKSKPMRIIYPWTLLSFSLIGFIFEFTFPENDDTDNLQGIEIYDFLKRSKFVAFLSLLFSFTILYFLILRRSYHHYHNKQHHPSK